MKTLSAENPEHKKSRHEEVIYNNISLITVISKNISLIMVISKNSTKNANQHMKRRKGKKILF